MPGETDDRFYSIKDAADYLGVSTRTVQRLMTRWEQTGGQEGLRFERITDTRESWRRPYRQAVQELARRRVP